MTFRYALPMVLLVGMTIVGCNTKTYQYSLTVKNNSNEPLMVGFAKDGPPFEDYWATPEQISRIETRNDIHAWGVPVAPGKTAEVKEIKATLERTTTAYVRVYATTPTLPGMLSISVGSPNRLDIPLQPGANDLDVKREDGRLVYTRGQ